jgi:hypothetical protein
VQSRDGAHALLIRYIDRHNKSLSLIVLRIGYEVFVKIELAGHALRRSCALPPDFFEASFLHEIF